MAKEKAAEELLLVSEAADEFREELDKQEKAIRHTLTQAMRSAEQYSQCAKEAAEARERISEEYLEAVSNRAGNAQALETPSHGKSPGHAQAMATPMSICLYAVNSGSFSMGFFFFYII